MFTTLPLSSTKCSLPQVQFPTSRQAYTMALPRIHLAEGPRRGAGGSPFCQPPHSAESDWNGVYQSRGDLLAVLGVGGGVTVVSLLCPHGLSLSVSCSCASSSSRAR